MGRNVVLVGCGNMGYAMLKGWLSAGKLATSEITVVEPNEALRARAAGHGVTVAPTAEQLEQETADLVIFAVKPQMIRNVVPTYRRFADEATYVSVAAGMGIGTFQELLGGDAAIIRCMPNTPAAIGKGMIAVFANPNVRPETEGFVKDLLAANGEVATVDDEALIDAVTAVSGSGPAYVFHFIECLTAAAEKTGLPTETAKLLALQTVYGAAVLAKESGEEPGKLREQVTSPNGTTAAALAILMGENRLAKLLGEAVEAARLRSIELGK